MVEAGERNACDVVIIEGTIKKQTQMDSISYIILTALFIESNYNQQKEIPWEQSDCS